MRRNPNDVLADLNEALRQGRVAQLGLPFIPGRPDGELRLTARPCANKIDLAVPAFNLANAAEIEYFQTDQAWRDGRAMWEKGELDLPYPQCLFILRVVSTDLPPDTDIEMDTVLMLDQTAEQEITVVTFEAEDGRGAIQFDLTNGKKTPWQISTLAVHLARGSISLLTPAWMPNPEEARVDESWGQDVGGWVLAGLAALALPDAETQETEPTEHSLSVNRGREHGRLKPIPLVRTINTSRVVSTRHSAPGTSGRGGWVQSPNTRRGHYRTLKSGRRIPVKEGRVHGGSPTPPVYEVR